jgi:hypothetical protein
MWASHVETRYEIVTSDLKLENYDFEFKLEL